MKNVVFIAKTDLNTDGRILNQIKLLELYQPDIFIDFILLPDKPLKINLGPNVRVHSLQLPFRHHKILRFLTVFNFTIRTLKLLFKLKPRIIHSQDAATVLPTLIYQRLKRKKVYIIYDDHEMPNENENVAKKIIDFFEVKLMKRADHVIFANEERMKILEEQHNLTNKLSYFLNLPFFDEKAELNTKSAKVICDLRKLKEENIKFLLHQGILAGERGRKKLAQFSKILPSHFRILLIGGNREDFLKFLKEYELSSSSFFFVGTVDYWLLPSFWQVATASIIMYLPTYSNNRYCAPNRFYLSMNLGIPSIVNKDNPVLNNFVSRYNFGFFIEDFSSSEDFEKLENIEKMQIVKLFSSLKDEEIAKFISVYKLHP